MNTKQIEKQLQKDLPAFVIKSHQNEFKKVLLKQYETQTHEKKFLWRGGEYIMKHKVITVGMTGLVVMALALGIFVVGGSSLSPVKPAQVEAQELVDRSFKKVLNLSPEEQKKLKEKLKADLEGSLQEARNAKDLEIVPESEIQRIEMPKPGKEDTLHGIAVNKIVENGTDGHEIKSTESVPGIPAEKANGQSTAVQVENGKVPAPKGLTILRYTDQKGGKVLLGIDKEDKPVFKMIKFEKTDEERSQKDVKFIRFDEKSK